MAQTWFIVLAALAALAALLLIPLVLLWSRLRTQAREAARRKEELRTLRDDLGALCSGAVGVSERVARLEHQLRRLAERQEQLELSGGESQPYDQAVELAKKGASADELVAKCGLTKGEAELVVMMNRMT